MKGQASVEFLLIFAIIAVVFALSVNYFINYSLNANTFLSEENYRSICLQIKTEIDCALLAGPYYERDFYLEQGPYNATISGYDIIIAYSEGIVSCKTLVNASKNLSIGKNTLIYNETGVYFW
jgi:uncharacterized protein (UPF0333 family)